MRQHAFNYLEFKSPFGSVPPWKVFVELFIDNLDNPEGKNHDYRALSHYIKTLSPFLEPAETIEDPHWTPEEASFIVQNVQAPPRDWMYLCIIHLDSEKKMAVAWLDQEGRWYHEQDPRTDPAEDDYTIRFEDDNDDEDTNGQDTASDDATGNGQNEKVGQPQTPKTAGMKRTSTAPTRQPARKKAKRTRQTKKGRPIAKASKFVVPTNQTRLDKWANK